MLGMIIVLYGLEILFYDTFLEGSQSENGFSL